MNSAGVASDPISFSLSAPYRLSAKNGGLVQTKSTEPSGISLIRVRTSPIISRALTAACR
jgi:hypothetical protein